MQAGQRVLEQQHESMATMGTLGVALKYSFLKSGSPYGYVGGSAPTPPETGCYRSLRSCPDILGTLEPKYGLIGSSKINTESWNWKSKNVSSIIWSRPGPKGPMVQALGPWAHGPAPWAPRAPIWPIYGQNITKIYRYKKIWKFIKKNI